MEIKGKKMPQLDELVIVTVSKIFPYGAFCKMEGYDQDAFLHVSEVSSGWVKNIRNFLKEGQRIVVRVHRIVPEKNMLDVSLKRVTEAEQQRKLEEIKRDKRATKLLEVAQAKIGKNPKMTAEEVKKALGAHFEDAFSAFEEVVNGKENEVSNAKITEDWASAIIETAKENIKKQIRHISGTLTLKCTKEDGIEIVKELLKVKDESGIKVSYLGAPYYLISVEDEDFKKCEKKMKVFIDNITKVAPKKECEVNFERKDQ